MRDLIVSIEHKDAHKYASLLDEKVTVFLDGKQIASSKSQWMAEYGKMLRAKGVFLKVNAAYYSTGHFLLVEHYNTIASFGGESPADCCTGYDAASYDVVQGKIKVVRRMSGGQEAQLQN